MKYLLIGLAFLMAGCETIEANLPPAVTKTQVDDHWPMDLMVQIKKLWNGRQINLLPSCLCQLLL